VNVYDFDDTIYMGDSFIDFFLFCLRRKPALALHVPRQAVARVLLALGMCTRERAKSEVFSYVRRIGDLNGALEGFWDKNIHKISSFYLERKRADDVVISASPRFLLLPACSRLGIKNLIASEVDPRTGKWLSANCRGKVKAERFAEEFPGASIEKFFSDSLSDKYLAALAGESYMVRDGIPRAWPD
jgi:hypothetical protein